MRLFIYWLGLLVLLALPVHAGQGTLKAGKLNLVVYFDYLETDPQGWKPVFEDASRILFNVSEGQLQLGKVEVFINCPAMRDPSDVWIRRGQDGGSATSLGLGVADKHIYLGPAHKSVTGKRRGSFTLAHEIGHYVFNLYDEYESYNKDSHNQNYAPMLLVGNVSLVEAFFAREWFCAGIGGNTGFESGEDLDFRTEETAACVMDGGLERRNLRTEWCTPANTTISCRHQGIYYRRTSDMPEGYAGQYRNEQEGRHGKSCWEVASAVAASRYSFNLTIPTGEPVDSTDGHQPIEYTVSDCTPKIVLAVDRSGSFEGTEFESAKAAAAAFVDQLDDNVYLGLVTFSTVAINNVPLGAATLAQRTTVKSSINSLKIGGDTALGNALDTARLQIVDFTVNDQPFRTANEVVVLFTDGHSNTGQKVANVTVKLVADHIRVHTVGLGNAVTVQELLDVTNSTGGSALFVPQGQQEELPQALQNQCGKIQGNAVISSQRVNLPPGQTQEGRVLVDAFTTEVTFAANWEPGNCTFSITDPTGQPLLEGPEVRLALRPTGALYRVHNPAPGNWTLALHSDAANLLPVVGSLVTRDHAPSVSVSATTQGRSFVFPAPVPVEVQVVGDGSPVTGSEVEATVTRPDGTVTGLTLYDDGAAGHGDTTARDGVYANLFASYTRSGIYRFRVRVDNRDGRTAQLSEEEFPAPSRAVSPFTREVAFDAQVTGVSLLAKGELRLTERKLPPLAFAGSLRDAPCLAFNVENTGLEVALVSRIRATLSQPELVTAARIFLDGDGDGAVDPTGANSLPLAEGRIDGAEVTFVDPVTLPKGKVNLLVTLDVNARPAATVTIPVLLAAVPIPAFFPLLALLGLWVGFRGSWRRGLLLAMVGLWAAGCVADSESAAPGSSTDGPRSSAGVASLKLPVGSLEARGLVTGSAFKVSGKEVLGAILSPR